MVAQQVQVIEHERNGVQSRVDNLKHAANALRDELNQKNTLIGELECKVRELDNRRAAILQPGGFAGWRDFKERPGMQNYCTSLQWAKTRDALFLDTSGTGLLL